jgi:hypothetical protein
VRPNTTTQSDSTLTSVTPSLKRKRDDSDQNDTSLAKMRRLLAKERGSFIANIDDVLLSLNLRQLITYDACEPEE